MPPLLSVLFTPRVPTLHIRPFTYDPSHTATYLRVFYPYLTSPLQLSPPPPLRLRLSHPPHYSIDLPTPPYSTPSQHARHAAGRRQAPRFKARRCTSWSAHFHPSPCVPHLTQLTRRATDDLTSVAPVLEHELRKLEQIFTVDAAKLKEISMHFERELRQGLSRVSRCLLPSSVFPTLQSFASTIYAC